MLIRVCCCCCCCWCNGTNIWFGKRRIPKVFSVDMPNVLYGVACFVIIKFIIISYQMSSIEALIFISFSVCLLFLRAILVAQNIRSLCGNQCRRGSKWFERLIKNCITKMRFSVYIFYLIDCLLVEALHFFFSSYSFFYFFALLFCWTCCTSTVSFFFFFSRIQCDITTTVHMQSWVCCVPMPIFKSTFRIEWMKRHVVADCMMVVVVIFAVYLIFIGMRACKNRFLRASCTFYGPEKNHTYVHCRRRRRIKNTATKRR